MTTTLRDNARNQAIARHGQHVQSTAAGAEGRRCSSLVLATLSHTNLAEGTGGGA